MKRHFAFVAGAVALAFVGLPASAGVVWNQSGGAGGADAPDFYYSDSGFRNLGGPAGQLAADNFSLTGATALSDITFWGFDNGSGGLTSFVINIYHDGGGSVGSLAATRTIAIGDVDTFSDNPPNQVGLGSRYEMHASEGDFAAINLTAGDYWLSVVGDSGQNDHSGWRWQGLTDGGDGVQGSFDHGATWDHFIPPDNLAFLLAGDPLLNPIPSPLAGAMGLAMLPVIAFGRRRCRS